MQVQNIRKYKHEIALGLLLVAAFLIRLWVTRWPPFSTDMKAWIAWGERVLAVGPARFYSDAIFADYAPGYVYVMWLTAAIKNELLPHTGLSTYHFLYRLPPMLVDLATGVLIYNVLKRYQRAGNNYLSPSSSVILPLFGAACHLFNPAIIINSAAWSQIDATFTFGMLLTVVLLLRGRAEWAVASYVIAFMIKPQAISLAPLVGLVLLLRYTPRRCLSALVVGVSLGYLITLPFLGWNAYVRLFRLLRESVEVYPYTSLFTYNLWGVFGFWQNDQLPLWHGLTARSTGMLLYLSGLMFGAVLFVRHLRRTKDDTLAFLLFGTYFIFLPVMVLTRMHERYLYPVLPFLLLLILVYAMKQAQRLQRKGLLNILSWPYLVYLVLTVLHTLNLYQVYIYYLYRDHDRTVPRSDTLFYFIHNYSALWSGITLMIFCGLMAVLVRSHSILEPSHEIATDNSLRDIAVVLDP